MQTNKALLYGVVLLVALVVFNVVQIPAAPGAIVGSGLVPAGAAAAVSCNLATTSSITSTAYDADKQGTAVGSETKAYFLDPSKGILNPGSNTVQPGQTITVESSKSNWFATKNAQAIPCAPSILMTAYMKAVDTAVTATAYDNDGITALGTTYGTGNNLTIGSGGSATAHVLLQQSAAYKHLSGDSGKFAVFLNATNVTDWAPAQMSIIYDGSLCTAYGSAGLNNAATPSAIGGVIVYAAVCTGDFAANDGSLHRLDIKYTAASGINPGGQKTDVGFAGVDYYLNTISGALEQGAVKDSGAAVQTMQTVMVPVD